MAINLTVVALGTVAILAIVGGGYLWLSEALSSKDKTISSLQSDIAALKIDLENMTQSYKSAQATIERQQLDLRASQIQADKLRQADAKERLRQQEFDKKIQGFNSKNPANLKLLNDYLECTAKDITTECGNILSHSP